MLTSGALVATDSGLRPVESLVRGIRVVTRTNGLARVEWVGRRTISFEDLQRYPDLRPFLVRAGAFGENLPRRNLIVSPSQRILVDAEQSFLEQGGEAALVQARHLIDNRRVSPAEMLGVTYYHVMSDRHAVLLADGVWCESVHPDDQKTILRAHAARREVLGLFPQIETMAANRNAQRRSPDRRGPSFRG